ncbi:hemin uptake protein HemP [Pseudocitrobacter faecalis]|uniref:hemin uptake protein HemP n=1 Tax=Pseudocitrobacter faecalis TaxID=1398493 RepID=UPI0016736EF2|nr:hemin uptake protein HemP [Pseudocitrobacter faecalis]
MLIIVVFITILLFMTLMDDNADQISVKDNTPRPQNHDRRVNSEVLLGGEGRVVIEHEGQEYLLRQTQAGKLILTK